MIQVYSGLQRLLDILMTREHREHQGAADPDSVTGVYVHGILVALGAENYR